MFQISKICSRQLGRLAYSTQASSKTVIKNPKNGEIVSEIVNDTAESIKQKAHKLREKGSKQISSMSIAHRKDGMKKFIDHLEKEKTSLATLLTNEMGKPIKQALNEINATMTRIQWFIDHTDKALVNHEVFNEGGMTEVIVREPLGVVANISAWNYPYFVGSNVFVPALLTGNTVLYKPSEHVALTGSRIVKMLHDCGFSESIQVAIGDGAVGEHVLQSNINGVFFTGSYETGKQISHSVAKKLIKVQLELGGKDPVYVHNDVDVKQAAESLSDGAMYNTGQSCCSVERIYVHQSIEEQFIEEFIKSVKTFKMGDPLNEDTYIGPLTRQAQLDVLDAQVKDALSKGATLLIGGHRVEKSAGNYYHPTVLINVNNSMSVMREESFGPIIGIQSVSDENEAIGLMNDSDYGLTSGVYSKDKATAMKVLNQMHSGTAYWNCCDRVSPRLPWSGRGHSGIGLTLSVEGITAFTQPKAYHLKKL